MIEEKQSNDTTKDITVLMEDNDAELDRNTTAKTMDMEYDEEQQLKYNDENKMNRSTLTTTPSPSSCYFLRWSRLEKSVQVAEANAGLVRSSITGPNLSSSSESFDSSNNKVPVQKTKTILSQVSGHAAPGEILALIGPSGSGKTTLLNVLCGKAAIDHGSISVNGKSIISSRSKPQSSTSSSQHQQNQSYMKRKFLSKLAYVRQEDIFFIHLTVRDQLAYTALLRLPQNWTRSRKLGEVDRIIQMLRLTKVQDSSIKLLSGGERKRVNIGTELLTNPSCLLLDEPTSGLDSTSAVSLVRMLSKWAICQHKTVIMSIHQPSSAMFLRFDSLLVLAEGQVVYFGSPKGSIAYLKEQNLGCPEGYNAADHWMDLLVSDSTIEEEEDTMMSSRFFVEKEHSNQNGSSQEFRRRKSALRRRDQRTMKRRCTRQQLIEAWDNEAAAKVLDAAVKNANEEQGENDEAQEGTENAARGVPQKYSTTWWRQYQVLVHRALKNSRSAIFTPLNMTKSLLLGVVSGLLWFQLDYTEDTVHDRSSYFFFTMTHWVLDSMYGSVLEFPAERTVILKERASGSYHLSAYFMAKTTSEAPTRLTLPLIYMTISFWIAGISNRVDVFLLTTCITLLSVIAGESMGLLIGAAIDQFDKALTTTTVVALSMMLLGGFYVENIPSFLGWAKYVSPFKYAFDASRQVVYDRDIPCDGSGKLQELCILGDGDFVSRESVLAFLDVQGSLAFNVCMLLVVGFLPRYGAYLALRAKKGGER